MSILKQIPTIVAGAVVGIVLRFVIRQIIVVNFDYLVGPLVKQFWEHAFKHEVKSPLVCPDCTHTFYSDPN